MEVEFGFISYPLCIILGSNLYLSVLSIMYPSVLSALLGKSSPTPQREELRCAHYIHIFIFISDCVRVCISYSSCKLSRLV